MLLQRALNDKNLAILLELRQEAIEVSHLQVLGLGVMIQDISKEVLPRYRLEQVLYRKITMLHQDHKTIIQINYEKTIMDSHSESELKIRLGDLKYQVQRTTNGMYLQDLNLLGLLLEEQRGIYWKMMKNELLGQGITRLRNQQIPRRVQSEDFNVVTEVYSTNVVLALLLDPVLIMCHLSLHHEHILPLPDETKTHLSRQVLEATQLNPH